MLQSRFPQIIAALPNVMDKVVHASAEMVQDDAKTRVHVRSGALRNAIHVEDEEEGSYVVAGDGTYVFYGHMEEFGTSHSPAHPFLMPALEQNLASIDVLARAALAGL